MAKLTKELYWESLKQEFIMVYAYHDDKQVYIDNLTPAIETGIMDKLVEDCADLLHEGNLHTAYKALDANLRSKKCNMKKAPELPSKQHDKRRLSIMQEYVAKKLTETAPTAKATRLNDKPQWAYGPEEIDKIGDIQQLQKVINSINDAVSKVGAQYEARLGEDYQEIARANRTYARKRMEKLKKAVPTNADELLAKIQKGGKVVLSANEAAALAKFLEANNK